MAVDLLRPRLLLSAAPELSELAIAGLGEIACAVWQQAVLWEKVPAPLLAAIRDVASRTTLGCRTYQALTENAILIVGAHSALLELARELEMHGASSLLMAAGALLHEVVNAPSAERKLRLPRGELAFERTRIAGILNVTPDSFYDGGRYYTIESALRRVDEMEAEGAEIVEVGGEKAGPGDPVSVDEELRRVIPVIEAIRRRSNIIISIDTYKPTVAQRAVEAGADIVNSIDGMRSKELRRIAAETGAGVVIMHIQGEPRVHQPHPYYRSVMGDIVQFLHTRITDCIADGIAPSAIVIDPGPGFGKTTSHDLQVLRDLGELRGFPYPTMLATSRKRFIGEVLNMPPDGRLEGSLATVAYGLTRGVEIVRTHDVGATRRVIDMFDAFLQPGVG
jgi:dihydropteroate synthase